MLQRVRKFHRDWHRRSVRDAVAVVGLCLVTYIAAAAFDIFGHTYEFIRRYEAYELDEMIVVAIALSFLMVIYARRRIQDLKREIRKRRGAERNTADHALRLTAAVNNMSQGLLMFDSAERLVICNERYLQMYNLQRDVVKPGITLFQLIEHRTECGSFKGDTNQYYAQLRNDIAMGYTTRKSIETPDGHTIDIVTRPIADGGWVVTHEDTTEKVHAKELIEKQELQLDAALENMSQGLCMFDAAQRLIVCNKRYTELYGLNEEQTRPGTTLRAILQHRIATGHAPDDHEGYFNDRLNEVSVNQPYQIINRLRDGRYVSVVHRPMADGGWVATHEDVTDEMRRKESFRLLFDNNPVAMWVFDRETLRFLAVNAAAVARYGYSREQFLTMKVTDIRTGDEESSAAFLRMIPDSQNEEYIGEHKRADGTKMHVSVYSRTLNYENREARLVALNDITDRKVAEDDLHRTKMFLNAVIENVPMPIMVKTANDSRFTLLNKAGEELFGFGRDLVIGKTPYDVYDEKRADFVVAQDRKSLLSDHAIIIPDHPIPSSERGVRLIAAKKVAIRGSDGQAEYVLTLIDDVTERREAEQRIVRMAHYDTLTDLPNRATFNETLDATINRATTTGELFAVLSIDFDGFKEINDTYGHMVGDGLLREIARRLQAAAGETFLARLGGDEFAVILAGGAQPAGAAVLAERLLATLLDDFNIEGHCLKLGMSIGVAIYPANGTDAKILMINADAALYRAKAETRGMAMFFEPEMSARLHERYALQEDLRSAIDRGELLLHYQPQVKMSGETIGFEALARWQCPKRGMVPPGTFIPIAEESSLIISVGEWVLREACREAASWPRPLTIAVNISPIQFRHGDLPRLIHSILLESGLAPARLELEITESVMINDFSRAVSILNQLKSLGVKIAMDDFGTGYSSLSYLQSFRCDKIKIDRVFICDLEDNYHSRSIVRAVIGLGQSLDLPILAEGVETEAQHTFLVKEGCDEVQGYLTGRPRPIADYAGVVGRKLIAAALARAV